MLANYLLTILRNIRKNKLYSIINMGGLALGLSVALLISLYVQHEMSYDKWINNSENVYRVYRNWDSGANTVWTPDPIAEAMTEQIPEILNAAGLTPSGETLLEYNGKKLFIDRIAQVDSTWLQVIDLPLISGNPGEALINPNSIVIKESLVNTIFGNANPIGQIIRFNDQRDLIVTGILKDTGQPSHIHYDIYVRYTWSSPYWTGNNRATYMKMDPLANISRVEDKITELIKPYWEKEIIEGGGEPASREYPDWKLQSMDKIHLSSAQYGWIDGSGGDIKYIYIFMAIACIVLLIAAINYINLSTARSVERAKEVGVRKVSGARRSQIIFQFFGEAFLQTFLAFLLAIVLTILFLPYFNEIVNRHLALLSHNWVNLGFISIILIVGMSLFAGSYPALLLSSFKPVTVLKGRMKKGKGGHSFRRVLVVSQFSLSVILVIIMIFIFRQVHFMINNDLGFSTDQVLAVPFNQSNSHRKVEQLKTEFLQISGVEMVTTASRLPGSPMPDWIIDIEGQFETPSPNVLFVDEDYAATLGIEVIEGRFFSSDFPSDSSQVFVVNETFVKDYNLTEPIGHKVKFSSDDTYKQIIGVIKDYHYQGLDIPISPILMAGYNNRWYTAFRLSSQNISQTIRSIEELWNRIEPNHPFRYSFLDEDFAAQYEEYKRFGNAILYSTILAMIVAVLGLFGLATYVTMARTKEIGIRKVLGASTHQLSRMLMKDFVRWVLIAGIVSIPVAWYFVRLWLDGFAYRIDISPFPFIIAIGMTLIIAAATVQYRAIRAAKNDPVDALRYE